jgi:hypothetical protein
MDDKPKVGEERERVVEAAWDKWRLTVYDTSSPEYWAAIKRFSIDFALAHSAELQRRLDEVKRQYTESEEILQKFTTICKFHMTRAEASEAKVERYRLALERIGSIARKWDGVELPLAREMANEAEQALSGEPPSPDSESTTTNEGKGETTNE